MASVNTLQQVFLYILAEYFGCQCKDSSNTSLSPVVILIYVVQIFLPMVIKIVTY